jgi:GT2 family glycosyltransferase
MRLERARQRIRIVRSALATLTAISGRDRNFFHVISKAWVVARREGLNGVKSRIILLANARFADLQLLSPEAPPPPLRYEQWIERFDSSRDSDVQAARQHLTMITLPELLILVVVTRDCIASLGKMVSSWNESVYSGWRAALVPSADLSNSESQALQAVAARFTRVTILRTAQDVDNIRGRFDYTILCFSGVVLNRLSTYMFAEAAVRTGAEIVYSDNDRMDDTGHRMDVAFKPQFSPEFVARYNYIGDCFLISRAVAFSAIECAALFQLTLSGYDRLVSALVAGRCVEHVPFILFHTLGNRRRLSHDLPLFEDRGVGAAIIIPTRDRLDCLKPCVESIFARTSYDLELVEIIIVDNSSVEPATLAYFDEISKRPNVAVMRYPLPFNFAAINNLGARGTRKEILVFLNNDTVVHDRAWLSKLIWYAKQSDVGVVGAKLLFPDGTVQHGGCVAGATLGTVRHLLMNADPADVAAADHTREMSLVTGACVAVRRNVFEQIGGFDPILKITWNDMKFCLECLRAGFRNIYIADPLLIHHELKTRGNDNTNERMERYFSEANYTRQRFRDYFYDDPSFNPNLSVVEGEEFAEPPRVRRPWSRPDGRPRRVLILSMVYKFGFGVPMVIQQQAMRLRELGYEVFIGGPRAQNDLSFPGCERVVLGSAKEAAIYAFEHDVSLIISHTPPYFSIPVFIGPHIPVLAYDYGEPSPDFFPEPTRSYLQNVERQKRSAAGLTTMTATISQAVKNEALNKDAVVVGLANSHFLAWSEDLRPRRERARLKLGWTDRFVVLTVCRFGQNERAYKGIDKVAAILREFPYFYPDRSESLVWALAGAGAAEDVKQVEALGFSVYPNVADDFLADLYLAADVYMGFSRWEGYNLGISQALATGLPTVASDIAAHREFPILTSNSVLEVCNWLADEVQARRAAGCDRRPIIYNWEDHTSRFGQIVQELVQRFEGQRQRPGSSVQVVTDCPPTLAR